MSENNTEVEKVKRLMVAVAVLVGVLLAAVWVTRNIGTEAKSKQGTVRDGALD